MKADDYWECCFEDMILWSSTLVPVPEEKVPPGPPVPQDGVAPLPLYGVSPVRPVP